MCWRYRGACAGGRGACAGGTGEHVLEVGDHVMEVGEHVLEVGEHVLEVEDHMLEVGEHVLEVGDHVMEVEDRVLLVIAHILILANPRGHWRFSPPYMTSTSYTFIVEHSLSHVNLFTKCRNSCKSVPYSVCPLCVHCSLVCWYVQYVCIDKNMSIL